MTLAEHIRNLLDYVFDANPNEMYTIEGLSNKILEMTGEYYSGRKIYDSIKNLSYGSHEYARDCSSRPYFYEKL